jgi:hypothetical protein
MWQSGVSLVTWFGLRDEPFDSNASSFFQGGLWLRGDGGLASDKPKLSLQAFRFPFVAFTQGNGSVIFWGRTPQSNATAVAIERKVGSGWVTLTASRSAKRGIFAGTVRSQTKTALLRARIVASNDSSVPFSLEQPADLALCVFGTC